MPKSLPDPLANIYQDELVASVTDSEQENTHLVCMVEIEIATIIRSLNLNENDCQLYSLCN